MVILGIFSIIKQAIFIVRAKPAILLPQQVKHHQQPVGSTSIVTSIHCSTLQNSLSPGTWQWHNWLSPCSGWMHAGTLWSPWGETRDHRTDERRGTSRSCPHCCCCQIPGNGEDFYDKQAITRWFCRKFERCFNELPKELRSWWSNKTQFLNTLKKHFVTNPFFFSLSLILWQILRYML